MKFEIGDTVFTMVDNKVFKGKVVKVVDVETEEERSIRYNIENKERQEIIQDVFHERLFKYLPDLKYHLFKNFKTS